MFRDLVLKSRSYRRFDESVRIPRETLVELVDLARHAPCSANLQGLKFSLITEKAQTDRVFPLVKFAGYLKNWGGPAEGERPAAYIVVLGDERIKRQYDLDTGIAAQTMMLGAVEKGFGGCMMSSVKREDLAALLELPAYLEIVLVLALGKPAEMVVIEPVGADGDIKYYRDEQGVHHVPKRALEDLIYD
jgi:nitroreductase